MATPQAENGKCPEGYTHVFGPLCVEKTTLDRIDDTLPDVPDVDFRLPVLTIQPVVENAILHGLSARATKPRS